jgi:hypothetical protein
MTLLQTTPKKQDLPKIRQQRSLVRGVNLRTNANVISPASFQARKGYMVQAYQEGKFLADPESRGKPRPNPMSDPAAMEGMMGMMKGNMAMMIPQSLIMGWINAFFSGFVISKSILFLWCVVMHVSLQALLLGSTIECSLELLRRSLQTVRHQLSACRPWLFIPRAYWAHPTCHSTSAGSVHWETAARVARVTPLSLLLGGTTASRWIYPSGYSTHNHLEQTTAQSGVMGSPSRHSPAPTVCLECLPPSQQ